MCSHSFPLEGVFHHFEVSLRGYRIQILTVPRFRDTFRIVVEVLRFLLRGRRTLLNMRKSNNGNH
ncbi:hypothetical protein D3C86_2255580 [compost metagenome]